VESSAAEGLRGMSGVGAPFAAGKVQGNLRACSRDSIF